MEGKLINIIKKDFCFSEELIPLQKESITKIVIHHTSRDFLTSDEVHEKHIHKFGWAGIGYNFFIEKNGDIIEARGLHVGAQAYGFNKSSIGIALSGDFNLTHPQKEQLVSVYHLARKFMKEFSISSDNVVGHNELDGHDTTCPGQNFDMQKFRNSLY